MYPIFLIKALCFQLQICSVSSVLNLECYINYARCISRQEAARVLKILNDLHMGKRTSTKIFSLLSFSGTDLQLIFGENTYSDVGLTLNFSFNLSKCNYFAHCKQLLGKIMVSFIMTGKIINREKYGGIRPKPPLFPGHNNPE